MPSPRTSSALSRASLIVAPAALLLALGLVACQPETETEEEAADTIEEGLAPVNPEPGTEGPAKNQSPDETATLLEGGVSALTPAAALPVVNGWINRLEAADFEGHEEIADYLEELRDQLQQNPVDGAEVGDLLVQLGTKTTAAATFATGADAIGLNRLGTVLSAAGGSLGGGNVNAAGDTTGMGTEM